MVVLPCLAYLLDTPAEPGAVVTYRCTRPAGHVPEGAHQDSGAGRAWTYPGTGVAWAVGAVYPVREDRYPWSEGPAPATAATPVPAVKVTPVPIGQHHRDAPWRRLRADAQAQAAATTPPAEELP